MGQLRNFCLHCVPLLFLLDQKLILYIASMASLEIVKRKRSILNLITSFLLGILCALRAHHPHQVGSKRPPFGGQFCFNNLGCGAGSRAQPRRLCFRVSLPFSKCRTMSCRLRRPWRIVSTDSRLR